MSVIRWIVASIATALVFAACDRSSDHSPVLVAGTAASTLPDARVFILDAADATLRTLDGNDPTSTGVSAAIDLGGARAGGVALDPHGNRIWITLSDQDEVAVFDATTFERLATLATGDEPGAAFADGAAGRIYIANVAADSVTVRDADPPYDEVVGSPFATGNSPRDLLVSGGFLVVANEADATISVYSTSTLAAAAGSPFAVGSDPADLESDSADGIVFVASRTAGSISVYTTATATVTTPITGLVSPRQMARHSRRDLLFVADGNGDLRVYAAASALAEQSASPVAIGTGLTGIAVNHFVDRVFVVTESAGEVRTLSGTSPFAEIDSTQRPAVGGSPARATAIEPVVLRTLISSAGGTVEGSFAAGSRLYLAHGTGGLKILDATDPRASYANSELGVLLMPESAVSVLVDGEFAYIANGAQGVQVADISAASAPVIERTVNGIGTADELFLSGRYLFVDTGASGLQVLDVEIPAEADSIASENPGGGGTGFDYNDENRLAYSASGSTDIRVIDLLDAREPETVETVTIPVDADDVAALPDRVAAVAAASGGLRTVQISPTSGSILLGQVDLGIATKKATAAFELVFVTDVANDLHVVNAAAPDHPFSIGFLDLAAEPKEIRVSGNHLHVAEGAVGLVIYRLFP